MSLKSQPAAARATDAGAPPTLRPHPTKRDGPLQIEVTLVESCDSRSDARSSPRVVRTARTCRSLSSLWRPGRRRPPRSGRRCALTGCASDRRGWRSAPKGALRSRRLLSFAIVVRRLPASRGLLLELWEGRKIASYSKAIGIMPKSLEKIRRSCSRNATEENNFLGDHDESDWPWGRSGPGLPVPLHGEDAVLMLKASVIGGANLLFASDDLLLIREDFIVAVLRATKGHGLVRLPAAVSVDGSAYALELVQGQQRRRPAWPCSMCRQERDRVGPWRWLSCETVAYRCSSSARICEETQRSWRRRSRRQWNL